MSAKPILRIWSNRNYTTMISGGVPSYITSWMQRVGMGWLAWEMTHSPLWLGIVAAADLAPMIFMGPFAGAITDRHNPLHQMRLSQAMLFVQALAMAVLQAVGIMTIEILVGLALFAGFVYPFHQAARHSVLVGVVEREDFAPAIGADSALFHASRFVGPALAGLMIPSVGVGGTFFAHAVGSFGFLIALHMIPRLRPVERKGQRGALMQDVADGFSYVRQHRGIFPLFILLTFACVLLRPLQDMYPAFAGDVYGSDAVGLSWLNSATGVGALISAAMIAARGRLQGLTIVAVGGMFLFSVATLAFVATDQLWIGVICAAFCGFFLNNLTTSVQTLTQSVVPDSMRGRVMGLYSLIWRGLPALGAFGAGLAADLIGIRATFGAAAVVSILAIIIFLPKLRTIVAAMEHPHD
jgi:MFS family permease